jgi:CDP-glucose 4,6-dehydratase
MFNQSYNNRRVLVTGHTGFKGSWLSLWLTQCGAKVAGYSIEIPSEPSHFKSLQLDKTLLARDFRGDIRDYASFKAAVDEFKPEVIFHLAAEAVVRTCYNDPKRAFETNLGGTLNVLEAVRHSPSVKAVVLITSDKCYENVEWEHGYRENDRLGGKDPYSASKACAELAFYAYFNSYFKDHPEVALATGRAGNVVGGGDWTLDRIVPDCIRAWSKNESVVIRNPHSTRPWQHVLEPLSGYLWLGAKLLAGDRRVNGESFNFGPSYSKDYSVLHLIQEMQKHWIGTEYLIVTNGNDAKKEASLLKLSCDKAQARLGWEAVLDFQTTAAFTSDWYRAFNRNKNVIDLSLKQIAHYEDIAQTKGRPWALKG